MLSQVSGVGLYHQHDPITVSPLVRDNDYFGNCEELCLLDRAFGRDLSGRSLYDMYAASLYPREENTPR